METTVMVGEKPNVASKLAQALGNYSIEENRGVKNYIIERENQKIIISPAVGHVFNLQQTEEGWDYPVFDVEWAPIFETQDGGDYVKKYYNNLRDQLEKADTYINACDFDLEGSVIGYTVLNELGGAPEERIQRMKFSTLTPSDLEDAFEDLEDFDKGMTEAGLTRHVLDFYYGINVSRALMQAVRENDRYKTLSTGRVQGPALNFLAEREREIQEFEPDPYWEIFMHNPEFRAKFHDGGDERIWDEEVASGIFSEIEDEDEAKVSNIDINNYTHKPPVPFNLTGLQKEASSQFNINPKTTQSIAQDLYEDSLISYPRTESQKLPPKIGYKNILNKLKNQENYNEKAKKVLKKEENDNLYTQQGSREDDAHPAIYPTGQSPGNLSKKERKVYDLIVKRFFAVFGKAAERQTLTMTLEVNGYTFDAKSKVTKERNWFDLYDPYVKVEEAELPDLEEGETLQIDEFELADKETQPPRRYSQTTIVSELEKRNLGTKATRAQVVDRLYDREFIKDDPIEVTDLGLTIAETLKEYSPDIVSEELTREFEEKMEAIKNEEATREETLEKAREELGETLRKFKDREKKIGAELVRAIDKYRDQKRKLGRCDSEECDGTLQIIRTDNGRFVGCTEYPDCENTYPLPNNGEVTSQDEVCEECGTPKIHVSRKSGNNYSMCIDPDCPTKDDW